MPNKILVVRNDKLGDFMLAYPSFALLKHSIPDAEIHALIPHYTVEMAQACPWIDHIIIDSGNTANNEPNQTMSTLKLARQLRKQKFDAVIALFSTARIAVAAFLAGIPVRIAPATKLAQIFYNNTLRQRRSLSEKPEYQYNLDLVQHYLSLIKIHVHNSQSAPFLQYKQSSIAALREQFMQQHDIPNNCKILFLHPGSGGSANNLSLSQYAELIQKAKPHKHIFVVITAGPGEITIAQQLSELLSKIPHVIYHSTEGIGRFAQHIQFADIFVSGSTGPLHIAGALNTATLAFYPRRRSATPLRWQTLNSENKRMAFCPPDDAVESDMSTIDINSAAQILTDYLASH